MVNAFSANVTPRLSYSDDSSWRSTSSPQDSHSLHGGSRSADTLKDLFGSKYTKLNTARQEAKRPSKLVNVGSHNFSDISDPRSTNSSRASVRRADASQDYVFAPSTSSLRDRASTPQLSSFSSISSLRSNNKNDNANNKASSSKNKKSSRFPFAPQSSTLFKARSNDSKDYVQGIHYIEPPMAAPPTVLPSAAAKRLGIETKFPQGTRDSSSPSPIAKSGDGRTASAISPFQDSVHPASMANRTTSTRTQSPTSPLSRELSSTAAPPPPRPEHPLEAEARLRAMATIDEWVGRSTFYSVSSDSGDDDINSAGNSGYASSHTSYGIASPLDAEVKSILGNAQDQSRQHAIGGTKPSAWSPASRARQAQPIPVTHHASQTSTSSIGSSQSGTSSSSAALRQLSFSRPFAPPLVQTTGSMQQSETSNLYPESTLHSSLPIDGAVVRPLEAIKEGASPNDFIRAGVNSLRHRKSSSSSRNFSRPHRSTGSDTLTKASLQITKEGCTQSLAAISADPVKRVRKDHGRSHVDARSAAAVPTDAAEIVILRILESLHNFQDLFACALLTRHFYCVFKKHELRLMKNALRNMSPAEWELREVSPKEIVPAFETPSSEYTPTRYVQFHQRDCFVLRSLKLMMHQRCQPMLRYDTISALLDSSSDNAQRVDDAFWRIWTFCTIFGCDQQHESNVEAQMDWLRGGLEASRIPATRPGRQQRSAMSSPSFGQGNYCGLSFDELYDMTEIWNALKALLQGLGRPGRTSQARNYGVFDKQNLKSHKPEGEQLLLDEWVHWVATQGLSTINDLAADSDFAGATAFATAREMHWTTWAAPPNGCSRREFLLEAISRVHEEIVTESKTFSTFAHEPVSERRKSRNSELAATVRERERGFELKDQSTLEDKGLGLWIQWMKEHETKPASSRPSSGFFNQESKAQALASTPATKALEQSKEAPKRAFRNRSASGSFSLFPPQYSKNSTPNASVRPSPTSSPMRSRQNSTVRDTGSTEGSRRTAPQRVGQQEETQKPQLVFSPRLSVCQEG